MFFAFLQGFFGKILVLLAILVGAAALFSGDITTGWIIIGVGVLVGGYLKYLSRHTVRIRA